MISGVVFMNNILFGQLVEQAGDLLEQSLCFDLVLQLFELFQVRARGLQVEAIVQALGLIGADALERRFMVCHLSFSGFFFRLAKIGLLSFCAKFLFQIFCRGPKYPDIESIQQRTADADSHRPECI